MSKKLTLREKAPEVFVLEGLDDFLAALLREVPGAGAPHPDSAGRFYPGLTAGRDRAADAEWKELVGGDLEAHFTGNRDRVERDLAGLRSNGRDGWEVEIAVAGMPAWIHALNQARLSLSERFQLDEVDLEDSAGTNGPEGLILFQMQFYGMLQEWLLAAGDSV
jgi:hypothetical protein